MGLYILMTLLALIMIALMSCIDAVAMRKMVVATASNEKKSPNFRDFLNSAVAGAISCSVTHSLVCPLDVVKTKIQTDVALKGKSTIGAFREIVNSGGKGVLLQGLSATFSGYAVQGFCKFGFYELIKKQIYNTIGDEERASKLRLPILLVSSGLAEIIASWALCPMEATRIYMVMNPQLKAGMFDAMRMLMRSDGPSVLFRGLPMIMLRQVPYTCAKLAGYEIISDTLKRIVANIQHGSSANPSGSAGSSPIAAKDSIFIQLSSGILAGVLAATISQPADVLVSKVCGGADSLLGCTVISGPISLFAAIKDIGFRNCYAGLQPRAIMVGSLTAMQFIIYEQTKARIRMISISNEQHHPDLG